MKHFSLLKELEIEQQKIILFLLKTETQTTLNLISFWNIGDCHILIEGKGEGGIFYLSIFSHLLRCIDQ